MIAVTAVLLLGGVEAWAALFSGTLSFSGPDIPLGSSVTDGEAGSSDISGVTVEIYTAAANSNTSTGAAWGYYSDLFGDGPGSGDDGVTDDTGLGSPTVVIRTTNGSEFSFAGIRIVDYLGAHAQVRFAGYRDDALIGAVTLATDTNDFISDFTSPGLTASIFQFVDEVRITDPGGSNLFIALDTIVLATAVAPNTAPTLSGGPVVVTSTSEDTTSVAAQVSDILAALTYADADPSASSGIAVTAKAGNGTWQYSTDAVTWNAVGTVASSSALLLSSGSRLRYVPDAANGEVVTVTFRAWDQSSGTASTNSVRATADTSTNGGSSAFSTGTAALSLTVTSANDAPTVANAIPNQNATEDAAFNFQFAANTFSDPDTGATLTYSAQLAGGGALPAWLSFDPATRTFSGTPSNSNVGTVSLDVIANDGNGGTVIDTFNIVVANTNDAPTVANAIPNQNATEDAAFSFQFAANTFSDLDTGATLTYSAQLSGGGALPAWLSFNAATRTFSGTPSNSDVGTVSLDVIANDGNGGTVTDTFSIVVANTNDAPTVANAIPNQNATEDAAFNFQFAANTFSDLDTGATLTYSAQLAGGGALPAWLSFDPATRTFSGTPSNSDVGTVSLDVIANDGNGGTVTDTFNIVVANTNDGPTVANAIPNQNATEDAAFSFQFAANTFSDGDAGATLTYSVQPSGGGALPAWLSFNAATRTFSGMPSNSDVGTVSLDVIANDGNGGTVTDTFDLVVAAANDAPVITAPATIAVTEDVSTSLTGISASDADAAGNTVSLAFSAATGTLAASSAAGVVVTGSGTGALSLSGALANLNAFIAAGNVTFTTASNATSDVTLSLTASDLGNTGAGGVLTDSTTTTLIVSAVNDSPVNAVPGPQSTPQDTGLVFGTAGGNAISVADVDASSGTVRLTLTAADGTLALGGTAGLTFLFGSGAADATMTFEATLGAINTALQGLTFTPSNGHVGAASISITSNDLGLSGSGGSRTDTDSIAITVERPRPQVTSVSSPSADGSYAVGSSLVVTVSFDQAVTVDTSGGLPTILLETGAMDRQAVYTSGSGTTNLAFSYVVQDGDASADLDYTSTQSLAINGATVGASGLDAILTLPAVGSAQSLAGQRALVVDAIRPAVTSVTAPAAGTYVQGQALDFTVTWSEPVLVTTTQGLPSIGVSLAVGGPLSATYLAGSGTTALTFRATVQSGQEDLDGITVGALTFGNGRIADAPGNDAVLTLQNVAATAGVLVDARAPSLTLGAPSPSSTTTGPVTFIVTYTGATTITLGTSDVTLLSTGTATGHLSVSGTGATARTVTISDISGAGTLAVRLAAGTAVDGGGNAAPASGTSAAVQVVDRAITALSPTSGLAAGGVVVTLTGSGFGGLAAPSVVMGGVPACAVELRNDGTLIVITPMLPVGTAVDVAVLDGATTVTSAPAAYTPLAPVTDETLDTDADGLPDGWELRFGLDALVASDAAADPDGDGQDNVREFADGTHPRGFWRAGLAEGVVSATFSTMLAAFNPRVARAAAVIDSLPADGVARREVHDLDQATVVALTASLAAGAREGAFATWIEADHPLAVEGTTLWDAAAYGAGAAQAVEPAMTWHLAEGSTVGGFDLFYLLANPRETPTEVDVTFLLPDPAGVLVQRHVIPARSRLTLWVNTLDTRLASTDVSAIVQVVQGGAIVVERAMYRRDGSGRWGVAGHRAAGVSQASPTWHFAEGFVGAPFDTYLLVSNPQGGAVAFDVDAVDPAGRVFTSRHVLAAQSRLTVAASALGVPPGPSGFTVRALDGASVVAERAMWWPIDGVHRWGEAHVSAGARSGARAWAVPHLQPGGALAMSQYVLIRNLEAVSLTVDMSVTVVGQAAPVLRSYVVAPGARLTLDIGAEVPEANGQVAAAVVRASGAIVVEASRYWDANGVHWAAGVNTLATPMP